MDVSASYRRTAVLTSALIASLVVQSCAGGEAPSGLRTLEHAGTLVVALRTTGTGADADGIGATVGSTRMSVRDGAPAVFANLAAGSTVVRVDGIAPHCQASDTSSSTVRADGSDTIFVALSCIGGLAYHELVGVDVQIKYLTPDGRTIDVTRAPGVNFMRDWSSDGSRILFTRRDGKEEHLYTVRPDGADVVQLTHGPYVDMRPRFSPDGNRVAFWRMPSETVNGWWGTWIMVVDADGRNERVVLDSLRTEYDPIWSRDGSEIYFSCSRFLYYGGLCAVTPSGGGLRPVAVPALDSLSSHPPCPSCGWTVPTPQHWEMSPDGTAFSFMTLSSVNGGPQSMWVSSIDGAGAQPLTTGIPSFDAAWAPDAKRLLVGIADQTMPDRFALAVVERQVTSSNQLAPYSTRDQAGRWSADGKLLAFASFRSGRLDLWIANADGSAARQLTSGDGSLRNVPYWNPAVTGNVPLRATSVDLAPLKSLRPDGRDLETRTADPFSGRADCRVTRTLSAMRVDCAR